MRSGDSGKHHHLTSLKMSAWLMYFLIYCRVFHSDRRGRGSVFHLRGRMVRYRRSLQNILHQNNEQHRGAKADSMFAGGGSENQNQSDMIARLFVCLLFVIQFMMSSLQIILPPDYPSSAPPIYQIKSVYLPFRFNPEKMCWLEQHPTQCHTHCPTQ